MSQSTAWCFTLNNPVAGEPGESLADSRYYVYQLEQGEAGTPHLQGYIYFHKHKRLSAVKKLIPRAHWEAAKGSPAANHAYCTKEPRLSEPVIHGELPTQGKRTDLEAVITEIKSGASLKRVATLHPTTYIKYPGGIKSLISLSHQRVMRDVTCYYVWGATGIGKTFAVHQNYGEDQVYSLMSTKPIWFNNYCDEKVLLIDEYDDSIDRSNFLKICDNYHYDCPIKGGDTPARWTKVIVLSNYPPPATWDAAIWRRFGGLPVGNILPSFNGSAGRVTQVTAAISPRVREVHSRDEVTAFFQSI